MGTCKNRLAEAVLSSTHNLCFGAKIRKIGIPLHNPVLLYKMGYKGVYITRTCFRDVPVSFRKLIIDHLSNAIINQDPLYHSVNLI